MTVSIEPTAVQQARQVWADQIITRAIGADRRPWPHISPNSQPPLVEQAIEAGAVTPITAPATDLNN